MEGDENKIHQGTLLLDLLQCFSYSKAIMQYSRKYNCVYHLEYMCFIPLILHLEVFNKDISYISAVKL